MQRALWMMSHTRKGMKLNSSTYEKTKKEYSENCSKRMSGSGNPMFGNHYRWYKHTEKYKKQLSERLKGSGNPMFGKTLPQHVIDDRSKLYTFHHNGAEIKVFNLHKFCRENSLDQGAMTRVNNGKQITHKGYSK